jgi:hypothetical protein
MGAPIGNTNATKGRPWALAIERALRKRSRTDQLEALEELAEKLINKGLEGDLSAIKEIADRLDGKPKRAMEVSGRLTLEQIIAASREGDEA